MKVLQINSVCGFGSTGKIVVDLYEYLEEHGNDCLIAYGRNNTSSKDIKTFKIGNKIDNYIGVLNTRLLDKHALSSKFATKKLIKKIKDYDPDIIHLHNLHGYYININILFEYLSSAKKPIVWTLHDCWSFTGHCSYYEYCKCNKWKTGCFDCIQKGEYPKSYLKDNSNNNYTIKKNLFTAVDKMKIVTPSKWLQNQVEQSYLGKYETECIYNGVDLEVFKPMNDEICNDYKIKDNFVILSVASVWEERKGIKYLFELAKILDDNFKIIIVGIDEDLDVPSNVIKIPRTNDVKELVKIYSSADVFVNPTLEETLGMVNIEALACGTPVITFNTGGSPECLDETCGIVVPKCDVESLKKAVYEIKNNPISEDSCVSRAKKFNKNSKYKEYLNLYESFLK